MKKMLHIATALLLALGAQAAQADLKVLACEPEWGALVKELAGDKVSVYVATTGLQDPHHIEARPSLVAAARNADLLVCTGAELEVGWLPLLIRQSGNSAHPARASPATSRRRPSCASSRCRSASTAPMATCMPRGNPHIQTDPRNIALVAEPPGTPPGRARPGQRGHLPGAQRRLRGALEGGHPALGQGGRAAARHPGRGAAQGLSLPAALAGPDGGGGAGAQARRRAHQRAPGRGAGRPASAARRR